MKNITQLLEELQFNIPFNRITTSGQTTTDFILFLKAIEILSDYDKYYNKSKEDAHNRTLFYNINLIPHNTTQSSEYNKDLVDINLLDSYILLNKFQPETTLAKEEVHKIRTTLEVCLSEYKEKNKNIPDEDIMLDIFRKEVIGVKLCEMNKNLYKDSISSAIKSAQSAISRHKPTDTVELEYINEIYDSFKLSRIFSAKTFSAVMEKVLGGDYEKLQSIYDQWLLYIDNFSSWCINLSPDHRNIYQKYKIDNKSKESTIIANNIVALKRTLDGWALEWILNIPNNNVPEPIKDLLKNKKDWEKVRIWNKPGTINKHVVWIKKWLNDISRLQKHFKKHTASTNTKTENFFSYMCIYKTFYDNDIMWNGTNYTFNELLEIKNGWLHKMPISVDSMTYRNSVSEFLDNLFSKNDLPEFKTILGWVYKTSAYVFSEEDKEEQNPLSDVIISNTRDLDEHLDTNTFVFSHQMIKKLNTLRLNKYLENNNHTFIKETDGTSITEMINTKPHLIIVSLFGKYIYASHKIGTDTNRSKPLKMSKWIDESYISPNINIVYKDKKLENDRPEVHHTSKKRRLNKDTRNYQKMYTELFDYVTDLAHKSTIDPCGTVDILRKYHYDWMNKLQSMSHAKH